MVARLPSVRATYRILWSERRAKNGTTGLYDMNGGLLDVDGSTLFDYLGRPRLGDNQRGESIGGIITNVGP